MTMNVTMTGAAPDHTALQVPAAITFALPSICRYRIAMVAIIAPTLRAGMEE
jgi:hypothetical protein